MLITSTKTQIKKTPWKYKLTIKSYNNYNLEPKTPSKKHILSTIQSFSKNKLFYDYNPTDKPLKYHYEESNKISNIGKSFSKNFKSKMQPINYKTFMEEVKTAKNVSFVCVKLPTLLSNLVTMSVFADNVQTLSVEKPTNAQSVENKSLILSR